MTNRQGLSSSKYNDPHLKMCIYRYKKDRVSLSLPAIHGVPKMFIVWQLNRRLKLRRY